MEALMPETATVEVLTAEVRVLMVGSRQVTLSVYNQLDCVPPDAIEPFGRVCPKDSLWRSIEVVGRDERGTLARSWVPLEPFSVKPYGTVTVTIGTDGGGYSQSYPWPFGTPDVEVHACSARWPQLPLIVLAGLR